MALTIDSILKLSTSKKVLILIGILCVLGGVYFHTFYTPKKNELDILKGELNKLAMEMSESKAIADNLPKFKEQTEKMNLELKKALAQLPNEKEIPEILQNISNLGRESSLEFILFKPKPEVPRQFYAQVPIELIALGPYHNIGIFFDKLGKLPRIINVIDFNMIRSKDIKKDSKGRGGSENTIRTSCLLNTYRFIEEIKEEKKTEKKVEKKKVGSEKDERKPATKRK